MEHIEEQLETLSRKLASKGIFKPVIDLRLGKPSDDSDPPTQAEEKNGKAVAGYYEEDGTEVVTEELRSKPLTRSEDQIPETAASSSGSRTGNHEDA